MPRARLAELSNKRLFGFLNWHLRRKSIHQRPVFDALVADLQAQGADHLAVTGDLINISLPAEFEAARRWLGQMGPADKVSVVPGNHDAYVRVPPDEGLGRWRDNMTSDPEWRPVGDTMFPFVRTVGDVALIGLCTAMPTPPFSAAGKLGPAQLEALATCLHRLRDKGSFRVVLVHHPPLPGLTSPRRALGDADRLRDVLTREGAELVLYGHNHVQRIDRVESLHGPVPIVAPPSASAGRGPPGHLARYNLFRIERLGGAWRLEMIGRGLDRPGGDIAEIERLVL